MAKEIIGVIGKGITAVETIAEGQEPVEFWQLLGGKAPYANDKRYAIWSGLLRSSASQVSNLSVLKGHSL